MAGCAADAYYASIFAVSTSASINVYNTRCNGYCEDDEGQEDRCDADDCQRILHVWNPGQYQDSSMLSCPRQAVVGRLWKVFIISWEKR